MTSADSLHRRLMQHRDLKHDLTELLTWATLRHGIFRAETFPQTGHLQLHSSYTREQITLALGLGKFAAPYPSREGVLYLANKNLYLFFADINKSEDDFSPSTMYDDYAISDTLFHWQSQSTTTPGSKTGQNFIRHEERGITIMLFIRKRKKAHNGISAPYVFIGPAKYQSHHGSRPMTIKWRLEHPLPAHILAWAAREG